MAEIPKLGYEIVVDHRESSKKCTILPLRYREDFHIRRFKRDQIQAPFTGEVLLHPDGITLDQLDAEFKKTVTSIAALDCIWRRLETIMNGMGACEGASISSGLISVF